MAHRDPVRHRDRPELERHATRPTQRPPRPPPCRLSDMFHGVISFHDEAIRSGLVPSSSVRTRRRGIERAPPSGFRRSGPRPGFDVDRCRAAPSHAREGSPPRRARPGVSRTTKHRGSRFVRCGARRPTRPTAASSPGRSSRPHGLTSASSVPRHGDMPSTSSSPFVGSTRPTRPMASTPSTRHVRHPRRQSRLDLRGQGLDVPAHVPAAGPIRTQAADRGSAKSWTPRAAPQHTPQRSRHVGEAGSTERFVDVEAQRHARRRRSKRPA